MTTLIGPSALNFAGLVSWYDRTAMTTTSHPDMDGKLVYNCFLFYMPDIDADDSYIRDTVTTMYSTARRPQTERALIDYMRHLDVLEEFYFVEGLREYVDSYGDLSNLRSVAQHYNVLPDLEHWLVEIQDRSDCK